jgi:hypothetical protein
LQPCWSANSAPRLDLAPQVKVKGSCRIGEDSLSRLAERSAAPRQSPMLGLALGRQRPCQECQT